ncbi:MAG: HTH-type transcriptional activator IlvY [Desulfuromusa sp.]|jgi:LysR family positive regulator for ilvC|nr:HTH-type transcriptional activator IlvY [Desulfuromusa sp.]
MDIKELEIFLTTADLLHFGRASQACNLSPSALTRTIQRLEEQLGQVLFVRDNRTVQLSPSGEQFRIYARQAIHDFESCQASMTDHHQVSGTLSLYASITAVYSLLPDLLEAYRKAYPEVQLALRTGAAEKAVAQVETGEMDIAVAALPDRHSAGIEFLPIMTTPLVFIAGKQLATSIIQSDEILNLAQIPLVLPLAGLSRRRLDKWLKKNRIVPNISTEVSGNEAIIPMVHLGGGVGIVPQLVLERSPFRDDVVVLNRSPQLEPYVVGLCSSRKNLQKPVVKAFWQLAEGQVV